MSNLNEPDRQPSAQHPDKHDSHGAAQLGSARRRRLIKLGASSVPVALTLASRPVFAGQCNTTSAWGSAILRGGVSSVQARATSALITSNAWGISRLVSDTALGGVGGGLQPWTVIFNNRYAGTPLSGGQTASDFAKATLKVSDLFPSSISGYSSPPEFVHAYLQANQSTSNFVTCMLVARINALYGNAGVNQCLTGQSAGDTLVAMATGTFVPSNATGNAWTSDNIMQYLTTNNIVMP